MSSSDVTVVILAAGQGTRMKSRMAKVLHRAGGRALVEHAIVAAMGVAPPIAITGSSTANDLLTTVGAVGGFQTANNSTSAGPNAFFIDLSDSSSSVLGVIYGSYFGGNQTDIGNSVAWDPSTFEAVIAGESTSFDGTVAGSLLQTVSTVITSAGTHGFVAKFDPTKSGIQSLVFSQAIGKDGGSGFEDATAVAVDSSGNNYVAGYFLESDAPEDHFSSPNIVLLGTATTGKSANDGFVIELGPAGGAAVYGTLVTADENTGNNGGLSGSQTKVYGIAVDSLGNAYISGSVANPFGTNSPSALLRRRVNAGGFLSNGTPFLTTFASQGGSVSPVGDLLLSTFGQAGSAYAISFDQTSTNACIAGSIGASLFAGGQVVSASAVQSAVPPTGTTTGIVVCNLFSDTIFPPSPTLSITKSHAGDFVQGQNNAQYTVNVSNVGEGPTTGSVFVTENIPTGLTLVSLSGAGWTCTNGCTRSDVLAPGSSYPPITVTVNVAANAPAQVTNQVTAFGAGSSITASASDPTNIGQPLCSYTFSNSPASAGSGTSTGTAQLVTSLTNCPHTSVVSNNPDWIAITSGSTGSGSGAIGYSVIAANNSGGPRTGSFTVFNTVSNVNLAVATFTINQAALSCSSLTLTPNQFTFNQAGGSGTVNFNTSPCSWSITGAPSWITLPASSGRGSSFNFTVSPNPPPGTSRQATLSVNSGALNVAITQTGLVCTYTITDASAGFGVSRSFSSSGGTGGINVAAPAGCPWTATPSQSFITISGSPSGSGNGTVNYSVAANSSSANSQTGAITIAPGLAFSINELPVGAPSYTCSASALAPAPIRPEGFAEKVADVVFTCGGQASPGGVTGDIRVSFNASITNRLLTTGQTDVMLLEDEPTAASLALGTNAFRGVLISSDGTGAILFPAVQLATASGGTFLHTWRITNARVNVSALGAGSNIQATVSITATAPFTVTNQPSVATVSSASAFSTGNSSAGTGAGQTIQPVSFQEGFASAFEPRLATGQDPSQAGTVYNSESGYVNSAKLGSQTGFATNGTRLIASIANVPAGVSVYASAAPASGTNAQVVSADATGAGGFPVPGTTQFNGVSYQPVVLTGGAGTATWEITASDATKIETLTFDLLFVNPANASLAGVTYAGALAPVSSGPAPQLPSTTFPVPRFASGTVIVPPPATASLSVSQQSTVIQGQAQGAVLKPSLRAAALPSSAVGGTVTWTQVQANTGAAGASTAPNVAVGGTLPPTWVITSCVAADSAGVCPTIDPNNPSNSYTVNYPSLSPGQTGTIMLTAQSTGQTSGVVEYTSTIDSDLANTDSTQDSFTANFPVSEIGLNVTLTHSSNFSPGETGAQYSVTISNGGSLLTSLPVTVTEALPSGLTLVSMAGTGWTCTLNTSSCTRSDVLAANSSYPSITVTVNVASSASGTVTNQVGASTGVLQASASDPTNIVTGTTTPAFFNGAVSLGSGVYYLQFPNGNLFGYYNLQFFPILYHYDLGFEAFVDGGGGGAYMYDFTSGHWFYTSSSIFPYLYDFTLNDWLYYFPDTKNPGHYTTNPRSFANLTTGKIFTM